MESHGKSWNLKNSKECEPCTMEFVVAAAKRNTDCKYEPLKKVF